MNNLWDQNSLKNRQKNFWNRIPKNNNNNFVSYSSQMSLINNGEDVKVYQRDEYNDSSKNHYLREDKSINNNRLNKFIEKINTPVEQIVNHNFNDNYNSNNFNNDWNSFNNKYLPINNNNYTNNSLSKLSFIVDNYNLNKLINYGFNKKESIEVLKKTNNNLDKSLKTLIKKYKYKSN